MATTLFAEDEGTDWDRRRDSEAGLPVTAGCGTGDRTAGYHAAGGPATDGPATDGPATDGPVTGGPDAGDSTPGSLTGADQVAGSRLAGGPPPPVAVRPVPRVRLVGGDRPALLVRGTVRSGRQIRHNGDVVVLGDLNPGGQVVAAGDIVVMGALRGMAHAGATGDHNAVVAAFRLCPTQLRIANYLSRPPDETGGNPEYPELALVCDGVVVVRPLTPGMLARLGPDDKAPGQAGNRGQPLIGKQ